ncbi:hypothetical protein JCM13591A_12010 [Microbacterium xylanilyticum]
MARRLWRTDIGLSLPESVAEYMHTRKPWSAPEVRRVTAARQGFHDARSERSRADARAQDPEVTGR